METVTISKAEYEEYLSQKERINDLQERVDFLMAQMRLARHILDPAFLDQLETIPDYV